MIKIPEQNPFELVNGQVILHDNFQKIDKTVLNYEEVAAIKFLIEKYNGKGGLPKELSFR